MAGTLLMHGSSSIKVNVDTEVCVGSGFCVRLAPGVFGLDADGIVEMQNASDGSVDVVVSGAGTDAIRQAELACPSGAISVVDSD